MEQKQFAVIVAALKSNYQNFGIQTKEQMDFWYSMLQDLDGKAVEIAVKQYIMTATFPPTIADIRRAVTEVTRPKVADPAEAWGEVTKAIQNFGSYNEQKALDSMSETTRRVVKAMSWREICMSENQMADRAHFIKMYQQHAERQTKDFMIAAPLKAEIAQIAERFTMPQIGGPQHE